MPEPAKPTPQQLTKCACSPHAGARGCYEVRYFGYTPVMRRGDDPFAPTIGVREDGDDDECECSCHEIEDAEEEDDRWRQDEEFRKKHPNAEKQWP